MTTFTNTIKSASTWSNASRASSSMTNVTKTGDLAPAGLYIGFGAFTYSGVERLSSYGLMWNNQTKN